MKKNQTAEERIYKLWWEYLAESSDYKRLCLSFQESRPNLKLLNRFIPSWKFFGDIHNNTFPQWWKENRESLTKGRRSVWNIKETFVQDSSDVIDYIQAGQIKRGEKIRRPTAEEFIKEFSAVNFPGYIYLKIGIYDGKKREELEKEIFDRIKKHKKECHAGEFQKIYEDLNTLRLGLNGPIGALRYERVEVLEEYLDTYKQGRPDSRKCGNNDSNYRKKNDQYLCAKRIIRNVERELFPGEYRTATHER